MAVALPVLPDPLRHRPQDQLRRNAVHGPAPVWAAAPVGGRAVRAAAPRSRELPVRMERAAVPRCFSEFHESRRPLDALMSAARLPHGLRYRPRAADLAQHAVAAGDSAVLDFISAARVCL